MSGKLRDEPQSLGDALADVPPWVRLAIGLFVSGAVGVYIPLCLVALFGIWQNNLTMWGFNLLSVLLFSVANLLGRWTSSVWWGAVGFVIVLCAPAAKTMVEREPVGYWYVFWPVYFTVVAGALINAASFIWYAKQTGLTWRRRRANAEIG